MGNVAAFDVKARDKFSTVFDKLGSQVDVTNGKFLKQGLVIGAAAKATEMAMSKVQDVAGTAFDKVVGGAARFQREMLNVNSITHVSKSQLDEMGNATLKLGGQFGQSAETMAKGLYDISSSGFAGADAVKVLGVSAKAATAGLAQTGEAAAGITAVLNAYGLKAEDATRVSDVLFQTVNRGVVTFPELSAEIGKTTALAAPLGVSLEEVAAGISVMTRAGIGAEDATTQLNAIMSSMLKPSAEAATLANSLGIEWSAAGLKARGLTGTLSDMIVKTKGNQEQMATLLGDARAIRGAFTLGAEGGRAFTRELGIMQDAAGATDDAFSVQKQGLAFKAEQLDTKFDNLATKTGTVLIPALTTLADTAIDVTDAFGAAGDGSEDLGARLGGLVDGLASLNTSAIQGKIAWQTWQGGLADATEKAKDDQKQLRREAANTENGFKSSSREMGKSLVTFAAKSEESSGKVVVALDDIVWKADEVRDKLGTLGQDAADAYFDPLIAEAEFAATKREIAEQKQIIASKSSTKAQVEDAKLRLLELRKRAVEQQVELIGYGKMNAGEQKKFLADLKKKWASATGEAKADIAALIAYIETIPTSRKITITAQTHFVGTGNDAGHAIGGAVQGGRTYLVGEKGPELFSPSASGYIVPNSQLQASGTPAMTAEATGSGGGSLTIHVHTPVLTPGSARQLADYLGPYLTRWQQAR